VGDDLGIRLRDEAVARGGELALELHVVLDDAVVDDDDVAGAVARGMPVSLVGGALGTQAVGPMPLVAARGFRRIDLFRFARFPLAAATLRPSL